MGSRGGEDIRGICPICQLQLPLSEIEGHVQLHFGLSQDSEDRTVIGDDTPIVSCLQCGADTPLDQYASHEAAHSLQADEATAAELQRQQDDAAERRHFQALQTKFGMAEKREERCWRCNEIGHWARECPQNPYAAKAKARTLQDPTHAAICAAQEKGESYEMRTAIIPLLKQALAAQQGSFQAILSGSVRHFQGNPGEMGWSCGYKNMQMQISHLLERDKAVVDALFGGCGYVPDVSSLQAWLECAWAAGFDPTGAEQLGRKVQGTVKWVGTTEAAALLRQFGVRARIVDFKGLPVSSKAQKTEPNSSAHRSTAAASTKQGRQVHQGVQCNSCSICPIHGARFRSQTRQNYDLCEGCRLLDSTDANGPYEEIASYVMGGMDHSTLVEWVWRYFSDATKDGASSSSGGEGQPPSLMSKLTGPVQLSMFAADGKFKKEAEFWSCHADKSPLYLQHEGHSRTIIGIEKTFRSAGGPPSLALLILDPSTRTGPLNRALRERKGWQHMLKRGLDTLKMEDYQILYCEEGLATGEELERLKIMSSTEHFGPLEWTAKRSAQLEGAQ